MLIGQDIIIGKLYKKRIPGNGYTATTVYLAPDFTGSKKLEHYPFAISRAGSVEAALLFASKEDAEQSDITTPRGGYYEIVANQQKTTAVRVDDGNAIVPVYLDINYLEKLIHNAPNAIPDYIKERMQKSEEVIANAPKTPFEKKVEELKKLISEEIFDFDTKEYKGEYAKLAHINNNSLRITVKSKEATIQTYPRSLQFNTDFSEAQQDIIRNSFDNQISLIEPLANNDTAIMNTFLDSLYNEYLKFLAANNPRSNALLNYLLEKTAIRGPVKSFSVSNNKGVLEDYALVVYTVLMPAMGISITVYFPQVRAGNSIIFTNGQGGIVVQQSIDMKFTSKDSVEDAFNILKERLDQQVAIVDSAEEAKQIIADLTEKFSNNFNINKYVTNKVYISVDELEKK